MCIKFLKMCKIKQVVHLSRIIDNSNCRFFQYEMEIKLYSTLKNLLSLTVRPSVTSFRKFLFACNLNYWFLGTSYFVYVDISDGDCGFPLCCDRSFIVGEYF